MTEEQLIQNIAKSNYQDGNYIRLVRQYAYDRMVNYNHWCRYYNNIIDRLRLQNKLTDGTKKFNKTKHKYVFITKYTKKFRYMSYRQALAIVYHTLEKDLAKNLEIRDANHQWHHTYGIKEQHVYSKLEEPFYLSI